MDANSQYELYLIKKELQSIINELDDISGGIRRDFCNIGNEQAAECVSRVAEKYRVAKRKLENLDPNKLTEGCAAGQGSGGGGGHAF